MNPLDFSILCICPLWVVNMSNIGVILSDVSKKCAVWMVNMSNITGIFMMSVYMCSVEGNYEQYQGKPREASTDICALWMVNCCLGDQKDTSVLKDLEFSSI